MEILLRRLQTVWQACRITPVRNMSVVHSNDHEEELRKNPYFEKYSEKILSLQKENPEEFKSRLEEKHKSNEKAKRAADARESFSSILKAKEKLDEKNQGGTNLKELSNIMKLDLIEEKTSEEISQIWETYHKHKDGISATIPSELYDVMCKNGRTYPLFVFPLPRDQGYEFFLCQVAGHTVHFTPLINYQAHKENAPVCLTLVHYVELKEKGIILMNGEFNKDVLDVKGAQCLANQYQLYYGRENSKRIKLLETLNYSPGEFRHMDVIAELECISM